jgi:hypothetical protein
MSYDYSAHKIVAVLSSDLEPHEALNVVGHLAVALAANAGPDLMGRRLLADGSGVEHLGIARYGFILKRAKPSHVRRVVREARADPRLLLADYPRQMLETKHDDELAEALAHCPEDRIDYLGALIYGPTDAVDAITRSYSLWKPSGPPRDGPSPP